MTFRRPARRAPPALVIGQVDVRPPPVPPAPRSGGPGSWLIILPAVGGVAALALILIAGGSAIQLTAAVLFALSALAMAGGQLTGLGADRGRRIANQRRAYLRHLAQVRRQATAAAAQQAAALYWLHPEPRGLQSLVRTSRLWERRPTDPDFGTVRLGLADQQLALDLHVDAPGTAVQRAPADGSPDEVDLVSAAALHRLLRTHRTVRRLPVAVSLRAFDRIGLEGNPVACRRLAVAMTLQAIAWHAPSEFRIGLCASGDGLTAWDWLKWAPQLTDPAVPPTELPRLSVAKSLSDLENLLADELAGRPNADTDAEPLDGRGHLLVIIDGGSLGAGGRLARASGPAGVTVIDLGDVLPGASGSRRLRLRVTDTDLLGVTVDGVGHEVLSHVGTPDQVDPAEAAATCRAISAVRVPPPDGAGRAPTSRPPLTDLIGVPNISKLTPSASWRPRPQGEQLRVPIGVGTAGAAVEIDIKDAATGGMGPHGLLVGAASSGRSELIRAVVLGLAITHPPDALNFLLVDGGGTGGTGGLVRDAEDEVIGHDPRDAGDGTFASLGALPHTSAVITGLADEADLIDRLFDAIDGELARRTELLRSAGPFASLREYDVARADGRELPALPILLVVIDEFTGLVTRKPEFLDLFTSIGRVGGPLGVHLLLAAERLARDLPGDLDADLTYRIGLRALSATESRIVLGDDAVGLPTAQGQGYLRSGTGGPVRFQIADTSGPIRVHPEGIGDQGWVQPQSFRLIAARQPGASWSAAFASPGQADPAAGGPSEQEHSALDLAVARLAGSGVPAHEVWLPPLFDPPALDLLLPRGSVKAAGDESAVVLASSFLQVPLGWVDQPLAQTRGLLTVDLSGAAGHVAIVGGARSGKSTALRSLICGLALTHTPTELQLYCLDFGGGSLAGLADLPHVGGVAGRSRPDLAGGTIAMVDRILTRREKSPGAARRDSAARWRERVADGTVADDGFGDVILVIDGWAGLPDVPEPMQSQLISVAARGLSHGVHVVLTARRWTDVPAPVRDLIGSWFELRLDDPQDSQISARLAAAIPENRPGRGLSRHGLHLLTAVPRIDGRATGKGLGPATAELVRTVGSRWPGPAAPRVTAPRAATPGLATPGLATPGLAGPGLATPGLAGPGLATPGLAVPPGTVPPASQPSRNPRER